MDPVLTQAVALLLGTISSALLIIVNYYFGGKRRTDRYDNDNPQDEET